MFYLRVANSPNDPFMPLISDDPVRPEIDASERVGTHREVMFLCNEQDDINSVLCVRYCREIPRSVDQLLADPGEDEIAVFYSVWSYRSGSGKEIIKRAVAQIKKTRPTVKRFVTLSPKTGMARRFHVRNGASILSENETSVNYEYPI